MPTGRVSENTRFQNENRDPVRGRDIPGLAVDPADPRHVVMITEEFITGQCDFHASFDGGRTWTNEGHLTVPTDFADPPCRTYDSGGYAHYNKSVVWGTGQNVYTTFASHRGEQQRPETGIAAGEGDSVIVNRSTDGGRTWERGVVAIQGARESRPFIIRPGIAVQPRPQGDKLYVVGWYVVNPLNMGAQGGAGRPPDRRRQLRGRRPHLVGPGRGPGPGREGARDRPAGGRPRRRGLHRLAQPGRPGHRPAPDRGGQVQRRRASPGPARRSTTPRRRPPPPPPPPATPASRRWRPTRTPGTLYVDLPRLQLRRPRRSRPALHRQRRHLVAAACGSTTTPCATAYASSTPDISVAPNGRVDVVWFDTRTNLPSPVIPRPAGQGDIYYASSTRRRGRPSRATGGSPTARSTSTTAPSDATARTPGGARTRCPLGNDSVLFAWGDARYGNVDTAANDVVLATMRLGEPGPALVTELPKASPANLSVAVSQVAYPGGAERIGSSVHLQGWSSCTRTTSPAPGPARCWPGPTMLPSWWSTGSR